MRKMTKICLLMVAALALSGFSEARAAVGSKPITRGRRVVRRAAASPAAAKPAAVKPAAAKPAAEPPLGSGGYRLVAKVPGGICRDPYVGAMSVDADTGRVLFTDHADAKGYPASVTKLMTILLVMDDIEAGKYTFEDRAAASALAAAEEPSKVDIRPGQTMTIDDLCKSIMVKSANDAAVVLAEYSASHGIDAVAAPEGAKALDTTLLDAFVRRMNARAADLGMTNTVYASPNGLPPKKDRSGKPTRPFDSSTAEDLVKLAREVVKHPRILSYTSLPRVTVTDGAGKPLELGNHNYFVVGSKDTPKIPECDGLKTGYTDAAGSSIVLTGSRRGHRVVVVVLSSAGRKLRDDNAGRLLEDALGAVSGW